MVLWGGYDYDRNNDRKDFADGARYPKEDRWLEVANNGPIALSLLSTVWTGSEMLVWGYNSRGRYKPNLARWTAISSVGAPSARAAHSAVWTGSRMIVWGGASYPNGLPSVSNTGGCYDPESDKWTAMSLGGAPSPRYGHTAV